MSSFKGTWFDFFIPGSLPPSPTIFFCYVNAVLPVDSISSSVCPHTFVPHAFHDLTIQQYCVGIGRPSELFVEFDPKAPVPHPITYPRRMQGGGAMPDVQPSATGPAFEARDVIYGWLLSKYGDGQQVAEMFAQDWVQDWEGWQQLDETTTDAQYMEAALRFERVAQANRPMRAKSNATRLAELAETGLTLIHASPHGENNCLIDSMLLGLIAVGALGLSRDLAVRRRVCAACRSYLMTEHNLEHGAYLDAHWDVPRILHYFCHIAWPQSLAARIHLYDRLDQAELGANVENELRTIQVTTGLDVRRQYELHIYNHTDENGCGYHFDLLWPTGVAMSPAVQPALPPLPHEIQGVENATNHRALVREAIAICGRHAEPSDVERSCHTRRMLRRALDEKSAEPPTDAEELERWKDTGYVVQKGNGSDNSPSLIGALWESLGANHIVKSDAQGGAGVAEQCWADLRDRGLLASPTTVQWADSRAIVTWLLQYATTEPMQNLTLQCVDRHKLQEIAPSISTMNVYHAATAVARTTTLRIYAYSTLTGTEWRYEALIPKCAAPVVSSLGLDAVLEQGLDAAASNGQPDTGSSTSAAMQQQSLAPATKPMPCIAPTPPIGSSTSGAMQHQSLAPASKPIPCIAPTPPVPCIPPTPPERRQASSPTARAGPKAENATASQEAPTASEDTTDGKGVDKTDLQRCLQNFLNTRSRAPINVCDADVASLRAKWDNLAAVGTLLQTWLGASVPAFDPTRKNAHVLAKAWMRYYISCTQGGGRSLGTTPTERVASGGEPANLPLRPVGEPTSSQALRPRSPPKKRYRKKAPQEESKPSDMEQHLAEDEYWLGVWKREHGNPDPRAEKDDAVRAVANMLRPQPLWPTDIEGTDPAIDLPTWHCAFRECAYETESFEALQQHILAQHVEALRKITDLKQPPLAWEDAGMEAYRAALTATCQSGPPTAHSAVDRRCLRQYQAAKDDDVVGAAICFFCARRFPHVETGPRRLQDRIMWRRLLGPGKDECLGATHQQVEHWFGYDTYWERYGRQHGHEAQRLLQDQLQEWQTTLRYDAAAPLRIICCPEDKVCTRRCAASVTCPKCRAPVCEFCWLQIRKHKAMPATALANDMLIFYAPKMIYQMEVTFMELVCASPCFTAMCCFSLEKKLLNDRALDQDAFMPRQRLAARGNATTFPLAWEDMLQHLQRAATEASCGTLKLPRLGSELAETVSVIIKTMDASKDKQALSQVIHQARVRRAVVLQLIEEAQKRDHPAY